MSASGSRRPGRVIIELTVFLAAALLAAVALEVGWRGMLSGFVLAILPTPLYIGLVQWLDRNEPEPRRVRVRAFVWGAVFAAAIAMLINTVAEGSALEAVGPAGRPLVAVYVAPLVEEAAKGIALLLFYLRLRDEFDNVTDGVIYAALVGLGFATTENVIYYGRAVGAGTVTGTFVLRGVLAPFAHPLFTALFGWGLGVARERRTGLIRWAAPLAGFAGAVLLHAIWNYAGTHHRFLLTYALLMVPIFLGVLALMRRSLTREAEIMERFLTPLVASGEVSPLVLGVTRHRSRGPRRPPRAVRQTLRQLRRGAAELAFRRWREARGVTPPLDAPGQQEELDRLQRLATALDRPNT